MIIAQNKLATTVYHKEEKMLVSVYKGRVKIDLAFEHLVKVVDFYKNNKVKGSVADLSQLHGSFVRVMSYLVDSYYPEAVKSGLNCQAYVISEDLIINNLGSRLKGLATSFELKTEIFSKRDGAKEWVKNILKTV